MLFPITKDDYLLSLTVPCVYIWQLSIQDVSLSCATFSADTLIFSIICAWYVT
jgi:hypothetical protein